MATVVKRNGKRQTFSPAKVKRGIDRAAKEAKLPAKKRQALVDEITGPVSKYVRSKRSIKATDLRKSILGRIDRRSKKAGNAWRRFDKKRH